MTPNEERLCFNFEHAVAIQQWAQVEHSLAILVAACGPASSRKVLFNGFYKEQSFNKKLKFADENVSPRIGECADLKKDWSKLQRMLRNRNELRNKLAHWTLIHFLHEKAGRRVVLVHPILEKTSRAEATKNAGRSSSPPAGAIGLRELVRFRYSFFEAGLAIGNFQARGAGQPEPYAEPQLKVPTLAQIRATAMAYLGSP